MHCDSKKVLVEVFVTSSTSFPGFSLNASLRSVSERAKPQLEHLNTSYSFKVSTP